MATKNEDTQMNYENTNEATCLNIGSVPPSFETSEDTQYADNEQLSAEDESAAAMDKRRKLIRNSAIGVGGGALLVGGIAALWASSANAEEPATDKDAAPAAKVEETDGEVEDTDNTDGTDEVVPLDDKKETEVASADEPAAHKDSPAASVHETSTHEANNAAPAAAAAAPATTAAHAPAEHTAAAAPAEDAHTWTKSDIQVADDVNDDMSFADAYEAARAEVGAGGVFVWHGDVYSTYTSEEWDALTPVERTQYAQNFNWNELDPADSPVYDPAHPAWADADITVATGVNDDMSFGEAFAAARAEVGAGGAFVWHGQVYGTYNAAEWNAMSAAERAEFAGHFDWNQVGSETSDVQAYHTDTTVNRTTDVEPDVEVEPEVEVHGIHYDSESGMTVGHMSIDGENIALVDIDNDGTFDVAAADLNGDGNLQLNEIRDISDTGITVQDMAEAIPSSHYEQDVVVEPVQDVEVVGVVYDENSDMTYAGVTVDGEEVLLIDANNDSTFDVAAVDANHDGIITSDELHNISDANLTVDDLNAMSGDNYGNMDGDLAYEDYVDDASI